jgi:hypothetical protein
VGGIFLFALTSAFNPTLLAATTVMLLLPNPRRLMLGYLAGALMTSITLGLVIVFSLSSSGTVSTTRHTLSPAVDIALGAMALLLSQVLSSGRDRAVRERRKEKSERKGQPRWQRELGKGSARTTFVIGAALTLPGASYLIGLDKMSKGGYSDAVIVVLVLVFNVIMLALLEVPLISFAVAPEWTPGAIERAKAWVARRGRHVIITGLRVVGILLIIKGLIGLIS